MKFKETALALFIMTILMILLVGCHGEKNGVQEKNIVSTGTGQESTDTHEIEDTKDELVICMGTRPPGEFDPRKRWGLYSQSQILHDTLLTRNSDLEVIGDFAKSYEVSDDALVWTFHLRDDYKFSTGEHVTADDVKFTYEMLKEDGKHWDLTFLNEIVIESENKILFKLSEPRSTFIAQLTEIVILPEKYYDDNYSENPIGSGPYKLVQWDKDQQAIFEVNPHYAGKEPYFKKFTLLFLDENAALAAAKNGTVDMIYMLPEFADEKIEGWKVQSFESNDVRGVSLPTKKSGSGQTPEGFEIGNDVTSNLAIRQALYIGVDRQAIVDTVLNGHGMKAYSLVDEMPWFNDETIVADNRVEDAVEVLEAEGWKDSDGDGIRELNGLKASFDLYYPSADIIRTNTSIVFAEQAKKLGIQVNLIGSNWDEIKRKMHSNAVLFAGGRHHPHQFYYFHHPELAGQAYCNIVYMDNPIVTNYLNEAMHASTQEEANRYFKLAQWDGETGASGLGDAPFVWLIRLNHVYGGDSRINVGKQSVQTHGHEWSLLANIYDWTWEE